MRSTALKKLTSLVSPGGLLLLAVVVLVQWPAIQESVRGLVRFYPYAVFAVGLVLGWWFHRSRLLFALLVLALADRALLHFAAGEAGAAGTGLVVFQAVAFLLPLNLAALTLLTERGTLTLTGLLRLAAIFLQVGAVFLLCRPVGAETAALLELKIFPERFFTWTPVGQPALLLFVAAFVLFSVRLFLHPNATGRGFLWALVAVFLGLNADGAGAGPAIYFATAGLILVAGLIQASYYMAYRDQLTGLSARRALNEALQRVGGQYTVAMVDIDHFKKFNDRYGHDVGDQVLRMVAAKLAEVGGGGRAFRYGGEEFTILFPGRAVDESLPYLERIRKAVEETRFAVRGPGRPRRKPKKPRPSPAGGGASRQSRREASITVSIGVAERDQHNAKPEQVLKAADQALYTAKRAGRNRIEPWSH